MMKDQLPNILFLSYSPEDEPWLLKLEKHLSGFVRSGLITTWHNRRLSPGSNWTQEIDTQLNQASIILLLISADFLASDYCYGIEMQQALARQQAGKAQVIPIIVRPILWEQTLIGHLHPLPTDGKPITSWLNEDEALMNVAEGVRRVIEGKHPNMHMHSTVSQTILDLPYTHNPYFTGRDEMLSQLHSGLDTSPQAICGLGGVGKTRLAVEYACRYYQHYKAVFWVQASTTEALIRDYTRLAHKLHLPQKDTPDEAAIRESVRGWLQSHDQWLLIFDNADEPGLMSDFFPAKSTGHILITTRARDLKRLASRFELPVLDEANSALFLLRRIGSLSLNASLDQAQIDEQELARKLSHELEGLPLALEQAGAYMDKAGKSLIDYLSLYQTHRTKLLSRRKDVPDDYSEPVATTWNISFERMAQRNAAATDLFHFCALLAPDAIPEEMITEGAKYLGNQLHRAAKDTFVFDELLEDALSYSLLVRDSKRKTLLIHRLVQVVIRDSLDKEKQLAWQKRIVKVLVIPEVFPSPKFEVWKQCERVIPHALECLHWQDHQVFVSRDMEAVCRKTASYLREHAQYREARLLLQHALYISEQLQQAAQVSAPDPSLLNELAGLYHIEGYYKEAEALYQQALHLHEQLLTLSHSYQDDSIRLFLLTQKSSCLNNLAVLYYDQERYRDAEPLYEQSLEISKQVHGPTHPDTAQSINNLAELYHVQKRYAEAEPLLRRALAIREKVLGSNHPAVALTLNALATFYMDQKKYEQAELFYQRALRISEEAHKSDHPDVGTILNNLANLYENMDRKEEAKLLYQRALKIVDQLLGSEHPNTIRTLNSLTRLSKNMEKPDKEGIQGS